MEKRWCLENNFLKNVFTIPKFFTLNFFSRINSSLHSFSVVRQDSCKLSPSHKYKSCSPLGCKNIKVSRHNVNKKGIVTDYLPWLLIAVALLVLIMVAIFILREKGTSLIDKVKDLFNF